MLTVITWEVTTIFVGIYCSSRLFKFTSEQRPWDRSLRRYHVMQGSLL
jgi:hypothetical protein